MASTVNTTAVPLETETLRQLASQNGPCITLLLPVRRPGAPDGSRRILVKDLVHRIAEELRAQKWDVSAAELLAPLDEFAATLNGGSVHKGGDALAAFRAPGFFHVATVPGEPEAASTVAGYFCLAPLATSILAPHDFYILGLSRRNLRLLHYLRGRCEEVALPPSVPQSEDAFNAFDKPDHELRNRSAAGASVGSMAGVNFGTATDQEARRAHEHDYYLAVDRGLKDIVRDKPLLLAGVHEEAMEFRRAARHCMLLEAIVEGNPEHVKVSDFCPRATQAAVGHYHLQGEAVLAKYREMTDRSRALGGIEPVLQAAAAGRVHQLCAAEAIEPPGEVPEDLINAAVAETLRYGGDVFMLPKDRLPADSPLAAILRF